MTEIGEILEAAMLVCFGISWPLSLYKSITVKSAKGKSLFFMLFILTGYAAGIASKLITSGVTYVIFFYILNFAMVFLDMLFYFRNRRFDRLAAALPQNTPPEGETA